MAPKAKTPKSGKPRTPRIPRAPKAQQPATETAPPADDVRNEQSPSVDSPAEPTAKSEAPAEQYFMVSEHITPMSKDRPGAQTQYVAGHFYQADAFLTALHEQGDPAVQPYDPAAEK